MSGSTPDLDPLVAGVDIATAAVRVEIRDAGGNLAAKASRPLPQPVRGSDGQSEQDARTWWPAVRDALAACTAALGHRRHHVRALVISATSGTVVGVDDDGTPTGPALMYDDRRAEAEATIARDAAAARWARIGITPSAGSGLARIGWLVRHGGPRIRVLHTPDLVAEKLVGCPVATDWSHALKSGYDVQAERWVTEALSALRVDPDQLPEVVRPAEPLGEVCPSAAAETGLPTSCQVRAGMTDGCASQLASGATEPGRTVTVLGTTLVVKGVASTLVHDPTGAVYSHRHPDGHWLPGGASNTGGEALADVERERLSLLDRKATGHGPAGTVCYPLRRAGERFPFLAPEARGFLLAEPADEVELHRARLEGVAFCEKLAFERLTALGVPITWPILTAGGGAHSETWCRIRASALGAPVARVRDGGAALGAALLAATGTLHPDLTSAAAAMVPPPEVIEPEPSEIGPLAESYGRFVDSLTQRGWLA